MMEQMMRRKMGLLQLVALAARRGSSLLQFGTNSQECVMMMEFGRQGANIVTRSFRLQQEMAQIICVLI